MLFRQLFDRDTCTYTYVLADEDTREAVLIDPVLELFERDRVLLEELGLTLVHTIETHVHADHVTASGRFRHALGSRSVVSANAGADCGDVQIHHRETIQVGRHTLEARWTPGHTDGCVTWVDHEHRRVFTGDALFIRGCGRTDFQQGDAATLYRSVHDEIFSLGDDYTLYPGHDYKGRTSSTVGEERQFNPRLGGGKSEATFVEIMHNLKLAHPARMHVAVPANMACGLPGEQPTASDGRAIAEIEISAAQDLSPWRVIDVRAEAEFNGPLGHLPGAELVPLSGLDAAMVGWDRGAPLLVVCRSGGRSGRAAAKLMDAGFTQVTSLAGGMMAWRSHEATQPR